MTAKNHSLSYADAGVDIKAGNALVKRIGPLAKATQRAGSMGSLGGFGGIFDLKACGYDDPLLVSATDGVGTKLKLAFACDHHTTVGIDLVAMCVNDLLVQGAEPLFFLDYFATGALSVGQAGDVISGIAKGCELAGCELIGGETAEMPGMYEAGEYDLAGFAVGTVERDKLLPQFETLAEGDMLLGLASSGLHSNGFSLVRKLVETQGLNWSDPAPFDASQSLGQACLEPTRIYIQSCLPLAQSGVLKAMAHITGGGLTENLPRVLPEHLSAIVDTNALPSLPVYQWIRESGLVDSAEMLRTFNCGIGMVLVVAPEGRANVTKALQDAGEHVVELGQLTARKSDAVLYKVAVA